MISELKVPDDLLIAARLRTRSDYRPHRPGADKPQPALEPRPAPMGCGSVALARIAQDEEGIPLSRPTHMSTSAGEPCRLVRCGDLHRHARFETGEVPQICIRLKVPTGCKLGQSQAASLTSRGCPDTTNRSPVAPRWLKSEWHCCGRATLEVLRNANAGRSLGQH